MSQPEASVYGEVWARIAEFPEYAISSTGQIMRVEPGQHTQSGRILTPQSGTGDCGYVKCRFRRRGVQEKQYRRGVHRLVALHHIPNDDSKPEVNHKDFDKMNNVAANLEWVTSLENKRHAASRSRFATSE
jgi:hypothetical protein